MHLPKGLRHIDVTFRKVVQRQRNPLELSTIASVWIPNYHGNRKMIAVVLIIDDPWYTRPNSKSTRTWISTKSSSTPWFGATPRNRIEKGRFAFLASPLRKEPYPSTVSYTDISFWSKYVRLRKICGSQLLTVRTVRTPAIAWSLDLCKLCQMDWHRLLRLVTLLPIALLLGNHEAALLERLPHFDYLACISSQSQRRLAKARFLVPLPIDHNADDATSSFGQQRYCSRPSRWRVVISACGLESVRIQSNGLGGSIFEVRGFYRWRRGAIPRVGEGT